MTIDEIRQEMLKHVRNRKNGNDFYHDQNGVPRYRSDNSIVDFDRAKFCPLCHHLPSEEGHDYCIQNLPGVKYACCGHGVQEGYVMFENGLVIRGYFDHVNYK